MGMTNLEMDDEEVLDTVAPYPIAKRARYPYGLRICLNQPELEKLKCPIDGFKVGDIIDLRAFGEVTCVSQDEASGRVEIQIQRLSIENEETESVEEEANPVKKRLRTLYGRK